MKKTKLPSLIPILILTLVTVIMWVSLDVYTALKKPTQVVVPVEVSQPLSPSLDQNVIKQIESRTYLNDSQIPDNIVSSSPTPTTIPTTLPTNQPVNASGAGTTQ